MKQILLMMLLVSSIHAKITQKELCQFQKVIQNGWSEGNQTLNQKIINFKEHKLTFIIEKLNKPIISDTNKSDIMLIPKIQLNRDDYIMLMSYTKYLEAHHKTDDSINIYIHAFQGLFNTKNTSMIAAIFKLSINNILIKSIHQSLKHNVFNLEDRLLLYNTLSKLLILDNYYIVSGVQTEKKINFQLINQMDADKYNTTYIEIYKKEFHKINNAYWNLLINAIKNNNLLETKKREDSTLSSLLFWNNTKLFFLNKKIDIYKILSIPINKEDYIQHAKYLAIKTFVITRARFYTLCQDYLNMIEENKKLLQQLKETK